MVNERSRGVSPHIFVITVGHVRHIETYISYVSAGSSAEAFVHFKYPVHVGYVKNGLKKKDKTLFCQKMKKSFRRIVFC